MFYCYCVALLLFVLSYVLIVCTVPLPPGVNPIAVDKYIYLFLNETWLFSKDFPKISSSMKFNGGLSSGIRVIPCLQTDEDRDMTKLTVAFRNFAKVPNYINASLIFHQELEKCKQSERRFRSFLNSILDGVNLTCVNSGYWSFRRGWLHLRARVYCGKEKRVSVLDKNRTNLLQSLFLFHQQMHCIFVTLKLHTRHVTCYRNPISPCTLHRTHTTKGKSN